MQLEIYRCEMCKKEARGEKQLRRENWLRINGGLLYGIEVWLETPRNAGGSFLHHVGYQDKRYDFCSLGCLEKAISGTESM